MIATDDSKRSTYFIGPLTEIGAVYAAAISMHVNATDVNRSCEELSITSKR